MTLEKLLPWANIVYIVFVALGSFIIYQMTSFVNANKDRETAILLSAAEARAAEANALAAQANLELARLTTPRTILPEQREHMVSVLSQYAGQRYSFSAHDSAEAHGLLEQLDLVLKQAGWRAIPFWMSPIEHHVNGRVIGTNAVSGTRIYVGPDYPEGMQIVLNFSQLLNDIGIQSQPNRDASWGTENPKAIVIEVGEKPL